MNVYNLTIHHLHSFAVGGTSVLVHNVNGHLELPEKLPLPEGVEGSIYLQKGSQQGAAQLQKRVAELNSLRRDWEARNGTTSAIKIQNKVTGETKILIATEGKKMPNEFAGKLQSGEEFIGEIGHAEQTILQNLGPDWIAIEGGTSRNICSEICQPLLEGSGMKLGGPEFRGAKDKTPYRMFWRE